MSDQRLTMIAAGVLILVSLGYALWMPHAPARQPEVAEKPRCAPFKPVSGCIVNAPTDQPDLAYCQLLIDLEIDRARRQNIGRIVSKKFRSQYFSSTCPLSLLPKGWAKR